MQRHWVEKLISESPLMKRHVALLPYRSGCCCQEIHVLRETPLSQLGSGLAAKAAVTLFLWGLEFMSAHQQPSRACNTEGIVSAREALKESRQGQGQLHCYKHWSYLLICSFHSAFKRENKWNVSDSSEQWNLHFFVTTYCFERVSDIQVEALVQSKTHLYPPPSWK